MSKPAAIDVDTVDGQVRLKVQAGGIFIALTLKPRDADAIASVLQQAAIAAGAPKPVHLQLVGKNDPVNGA